MNDTMNEIFKASFFDEIEKIAAPGTASIAKLMSRFKGAPAKTDFSRKLMAALSGAKKPAMEGALAGATGGLVVSGKKSFGRLDKLFTRIDKSPFSNTRELKRGIVTTLLPELLRDAGKKAAIGGTAMGLKRGFSAGKKAWMAEALKIGREKEIRGAALKTGLGAGGIAGIGALSSMMF